jgi:phosphoribosylanthranilate isomerase
MTPEKTSIKFCGLVRPQDVDFAAQLEVNALGLVFYEKSSRLLDLDTAKQLRALMPSWINCVGLFVNSPPEHVKTYSKALGLDVVQFHGDESYQTCQESLLPGQQYWRAIRVREQADLVNSWASYPDAKAFILDAYSEGFGGSGHKFDWSLIPANRPESLIMSGGLDSESVIEVINQIAPFGVDVSSGIQGEDPRMKDHQKMQAFVDAVAQADAAANQRVSR